MNTNLVKNRLHESIADAVLNELYRGVGNYYYYLGRPLNWFDPDDLPEQPKDHVVYENGVRRDIIGLTKINPNDVSPVIKRIDWEAGRVYDMYDDQYGSGLVGINLVSGGIGYTTPPEVVITGDGYGAVGEAIISGGQVIEIRLIRSGYEYSEPPTIELVDGGGQGAQAEAVMAAPVNKADPLQDTNFYVLTEDFNVYKCLDNNNKGLSTTKPTGIQTQPFETTDGYVWKYMYTIPVALRERFLAVDLMPVTTALTQQFYSGGTIRNVRVDTMGSGYTFANATVVGNGHQEKDVYFFNGAVIESPGSGYVDGEELIVEDPLPTTDWEQSKFVYRGTMVKYETRIYEAENTGELGSTPPSHNVGSVYNGGVVLNYYGRTASGRIQVTSGEITGLEFDGQLQQINVTNGGTGYTTIPNISFLGTVNCVADAIMSEGRLQAVQIIATDYDLTTAPSVIVGDEWEESTSLTIGDQVFVSDRLYTCVTAGTTGTTAPTHTTGTETNGTTELEYAGEAAKATATLQFGEGYKTPLPEVSVDTAAGTGAVLTAQTSKSSAILQPIIQGGQVVDINVINGGVAYTTAEVQITGDGTGASATVDLSIGDIDSQQANVELSAIDGQISTIVPTSNGYGYNSAAVEIEGDGTGAEATAIVENGRVVRVTLNSRGKGYSWVNVKITGDGFGAKARAILPPIGGHGSDSIKELYCDTLMFFKDISYDRYQGFSVGNEYRQVGIIKNPRAKNGTRNRGTFFTSPLGSCCYAATSAAFGGVALEKDQELKDSEGNRYVVVEIDGDRLLLQDVDNNGIENGTALYTSEDIPVPLTDIVEPQIDKFSGDLLFIDNRMPFAPSSEEIINVRTVLQF